MKKRIAILFAGMFVIGPYIGQAQKHSVHHTRTSHKKPEKVHYGTASFYANKFNGKRTANGEVFSQKRLTAACNHVSLNSWVRVTNLRNRKSVVVKITDRMHPKNQRLIDLSRVAASDLGYTGRGLTRVKVEELGRIPPHGWRAEPSR
jgi:rare lipoprotein A